MALRQRTGSTVCPGCGTLVGVNDETCYSCGRRNPALWGFSPLLRRLGRDLGLTNVITVVCVGLYLATAAASQEGGGMSILSPSGRALVIFGATGAPLVFEAGHWWTLLSATWLHGGLLHILFNMYGVRQLVPATVEMYGPGRTMIIYTLGGATGFLASALAGEYLSWIPLPLIGGHNGITIGASAALFAMMGALYYYGHRSGSSMMRREVGIYAAFCFLSVAFIGNIDNYAHAGGFAGGFLISKWLDPLRPERGDHLIAGLTCLVASWLAVLVSIVTLLRYLAR
jgi:membrane associated rhomboid family serine protease